MSSQPRQQTYIAKIRYRNEIPPPPGAPKLLDIPISLQKYTDTSFTSELIREQPVNVELDAELGMPLDLTQIPEVFEGNQRVIHPDPKPLHPKDKALMKDVDSILAARKAGPAVSFLRRPEYISSEGARQAKGAGLSSPASAIIQVDARMQELEDPERQIKAIEAGFEAANEPLSTLKHAENPSLIAEEAWPILPDMDIAGEDILLCRFMEDPAIYRSTAEQKELDEETQEDLLQVALLRPTNTADDRESWFSYYIPESTKDAHVIRNDRFQYETEDIDAVYRYTRTRDYDFTLVPSLHREAITDIILSFEKSGKKRAIYTPITARTVLKRRRALRKHINNVEELTGIDLRLRSMRDDEKQAVAAAQGLLDPIGHPYTAPPEAVDLEEPSVPPDDHEVNEAVT